VLRGAVPNESLPNAPAALETQPEGDRLDDVFWLPRRSAKALPAAFRPSEATVQVLRSWRHIALPDLLLALAACDRRRDLSGPCGARFTDLAVAAHYREFWRSVLGSVQPINGRYALNSSYSPTVQRTG
jgi:hypothetical protein